MQFVRWLQQQMHRRSTSQAWGLAPEQQGWFLVGLMRDTSAFLKLKTAQHLDVSLDDQGLDGLSDALRQMARARATFQIRQRVNMGLPPEQVVGGVMAMPADLGSADLEAEVQFEAARALKLEPDQVSFDWQAALLSDGVVHRLHWAACDKAWIDLFQQCALRSGWRLASVEPVDLAARRAATCLCGGMKSVFTQPVQDWQFDPLRLSDLATSDGEVGLAGVFDEALHDAMRTPLGPRLAAVGLALKAWT